MNQQEASWQAQRSVCAAICQGNGLKAKEIARLLDLDRGTVNHILYSSPLLKELCWQDDDYRWHGIIQQSRPHRGLYEFSGFLVWLKSFLLFRKKNGCSSLPQDAGASAEISTTPVDCCTPFVIAG